MKHALVPRHSKRITCTRVWVSLDMTGKNGVVIKWSLSLTLTQPVSKIRVVIDDMHRVQVSLNTVSKKGVMIDDMQWGLNLTRHSKKREVIEGHARENLTNSRRDQHHQLTFGVATATLRST